MQSNQISIITPSLNSAQVISDCIQSVDGQGPSVEHVIVDGGSNDGTLDIIKSSRGKAKLINAPPNGIYAALNTGILASSGNIIGALHADDFYAANDVLARVQSAFENDSVDACYGDLCYVDRTESKRVIRYWRAGKFSVKNLLNGWMPPHPTFFVRRNVLERFGLYRTDLGTAADYEMIVRLLMKYRVKVVYIPGVLVHMRTGGASNSSWRARIQANRMDRQAWKVNGLRPYPWTTVAKPLRKIGQWISRP